MLKFGISEKKYHHKGNKVHEGKPKDLTTEVTDATEKKPLIISVLSVCSVVGSFNAGAERRFFH
jgi:hypothetical protein